MHEDADDLVTVARFFAVHEAELAAGYLESHGVDVHVADLDAARVYSYGVLAMGGFRVQVRRVDAGRAQELLENPEMLEEDAEIG